MSVVQLALFSALITVAVSLFISAMIKIMVLLINRFGKPDTDEPSAVQTDSANLSDIAALIAIVKSQKLSVKVGLKV